MANRIRCPDDYVEMTYEQRDAADGGTSWDDIGGQVLTGCYIVGTVLVMHRAATGHWLWQRGNRQVPSPPGDQISVGDCENGQTPDTPGEDLDCSFRTPTF